MYNKLQQIKREFFSFRNGIVADALRKGGSKFRIIFGLTLPQLVEIASRFGTDDDLATQLWNNTTTRESMLVAPMLASRDNFSIDKARVWAGDIPEYEVADILCHRLLRHMDYAPELALELASSDSELAAYTGVRLAFNILNRHPEVARKVADMPHHGAAAVLAERLAEELEFFQ